MEKRNRSEFFVALTQKVLKIPILQVIGSLEQIYGSGGHPIPPEQLGEIRGGSYFALCPFHADEKIGSFVITPEKQMWWCFVENLGWNGIHYEQKKFGLSFEDAVFHLAKRFGLITEQEEKRYAGKKIDADVIEHITANIKKPNMDRPGRKASPEHIEFVYSTMAERGLKPSHREHLLRERMLTEDDLGDYFTFPTRNADLAKAAVRKYAGELAKGKWTKLSREEKKRIMEGREMKEFTADLPYVPGFFKNGDKVDFASQTGIGFLVRDDLGDIKGIQIRRDAIKEGESRYVWFSSAFAAYKDNLKGGNSPGAPGGVIFPKEKKEKPLLCITEGRFKAHALARAGFTAIYVSGVSSWRNVTEMFERLKKEYGIAKVYVIFDSDMMGNTAVHGQLSSLCGYIEKNGCEAVLLLWKIRYGKGFDDLVFKTGESYKKHLIPIRFKNFEKGYRKVLRDSLRTLGVNTSKADCGRARYEDLIKDVPQEKRKLFNRMMQGGLEDAIDEAKKKKEEK